MSLRDLYDAVTAGLYGGRTDPVTGLPYRLQDSMPEAVLTQCRHWVNYPQVFTAIGTECFEFTVACVLDPVLLRSGMPRSAVRCQWQISRIDRLPD